MTRHNNVGDMTVTEIIGNVRERICDEYCKYTEQYRSCYKNPDEAHEKLLFDMCNFCPMNRL